MNRAKFSRILESVTNLAVLLASLLILWIGVRYFLPQTRLIEYQPGLQKGQHLQVWPLIARYSGNSLLIFSSTKCAYCLDSIPFYRKILEKQLSNGTFQVIGVFQEDRNEVQKYIAANKLSLKEIITEFDYRKVNISSTPTLILVNNKGDIIDFWTGSIPSSYESKVISSIEMVR